MPLALYALAAAICASRLVMGGLVGEIALAVPLVALTALFLCLVRQRVAWATVATVICAAGAACTVACEARVASMEALAGELGTSPVSGWTFELEGDMSPGAAAWRGRAHALGGASAGDVWLVLPDEEASGTRVCCVGRFSPSGDDEWGRSSRMQGVVGTVKATHVLSCEEAEGPRAFLLALRRCAIDAIDPRASDVRAMLAACVCGYSPPLRASGLSDELSCTGISHMVAVSGAHLALVATTLTRLLEMTRLPRRARSLLTLGATGLFVAFCGAPVSAVRAWLMCGAGEVSSLAGRRAHQLSAASVVGLAMVLLEPALAGQMGFLLSVLSVCGIGLFGGYARAVLKDLVPGPRPSGGARLRRAAAHAWREARGILSISLVCQAFTLPVTAASFGSVSTLAVVANLVAMPFFSLLLPLGLLAALLSGAPSLAGPVLAVAEAVGWPLVQVVRWASGQPLVRVPVGWDMGVGLLALAVTSAMLLVFWPRPSRRHAMAALLASLAILTGLYVRWRWLAPARVCVLDVGQGDAILVQDGGAALLVDAGPDGSVASALLDERVLHLDAVLITHLHDDHYGGLLDLRGVVGVDEVILGNGVVGNLPQELADSVGGICGGHVSEVGYGDVMSVGRFSLRVISPTTATDGLENEDSLELLLSFRDGERSLSALLTGDAEDGQTLAAVRRGDVGDIDLLKVGHHGSAASIGEEAVRVLLPEVSVASAGEGNSYGHPREECVEVLEGVGSTFLCTKDVGSVTVFPGERGPWVTCARSP